MKPVCPRLKNTHKWIQGSLKPLNVAKVSPHWLHILMWFLSSYVQSIHLQTIIAGWDRMLRKLLLKSRRAANLLWAWLQWKRSLDLASCHHFTLTSWQIPGETIGFFWHSTCHPQPRVRSLCEELIIMELNLLSRGRLITELQFCGLSKISCSDAA